MGCQVERQVGELARRLTCHGLVGLVGGAWLALPHGEMSSAPPSMRGVRFTVWTWDACLSAEGRRAPREREDACLTSSSGARRCEERCPETPYPHAPCIHLPAYRLAPTSLPPAACVHLKGPAKSPRCVTALTARERSLALCAAGRPCTAPSRRMGRCSRARRCTRACRRSGRLSALVVPTHSSRPGDGHRPRGRSCSSARAPARSAARP